MQLATVNAIEVLIAHTTTPAELASALSGAHQGELLNTGAAALSTSASVTALLGRSVPLYGVAANGGSLALSSIDAAIEFDETGTLSDNTIQGMVGGALGLMGSVALVVATVGAVGAAVPILVTVGAIATIAGAAYTLASLQGDYSTEIADQFRDAVASLRATLGDAYDQAVAAMTDAIEFAANSLEALTAAMLAGLQSLSDLYRGLIDGLLDTAEEIQNEVSEFFGGAQNWFPRRDPLTLDLDGDGIESTGVNQTNPILFDHDGDGVKHGTGWISSDDGFLVLDRNGNGAIDSGRELFGDSTRLANGENAEDGFAALAAEDTNSDGAVTAADARFDQLRVWRDLNQDGVSQSGELFTLQQLGITAINVAAVERNQTLQNGNRIADVGTYVRSDGSEGTIGETHGTADVDLAENTFYREFPDQIPLADGITDLPNMSGSGLVRDLWEAASLSTDLRGLLEQFSQATTRAQQLALIDQLLLSWANTAGMGSMEERAGDSSYGLRWQQIGSATNEWAGFIRSSGGGGGGEGGGVVSQEELERRLAWDATLARTRSLFTVLEAFNGRYFFAFPEDSFTGAQSGLRTLSMEDPDDPPDGDGRRPMHPVIQLIIAQPQIDALNASYEALRESIYNSLSLQTRLQSLTDMIVLAPDPSGGGLILDFQDLEAELQHRIQQNVVDGMADLIEYTRGMSRRLMGTAWNGWALVEQNVRSLPLTTELEALYAEFDIQVGDGNATVIRGGERSSLLLGTAFGEQLFGECGNDALMGGEGNDQLYGGAGSDTLLGQADSDSLYGGAGSDLLEGSAGNDHLSGDAGDDTYLFARGDGRDTIYNYDTTEGRSDVLRFGPGIGASDIVLTRSGDSLIVSIRESNDSVTIQSFFSSSNNYTITAIVLADGTQWDLETLRAKVQTGTDGADVLTAHESGSALYGLGGNDELHGGAGNDYLEDYSGANVLRGGAGVDTLLGTGTFEGGAGDDVISATSYTADTHVFNVGDGRDTITETSYAYQLDTLSFGAGIAPASVTLVRSGNDMIFRISDTDQVTVKNWFESVYYNAIERVQFADGTTWDMAAMQAMTPTAYVGSESAETINGWEGLDVIDGAGGNDTINGYGGNDRLAGGEGNDTLNAGEGHDQVLGGAGDDLIDGVGGNDIRQGGAGADTLTDQYDNNVFDGGADNDSLTGGSGRELFIGGAGDDSINTGFGADVIAFARGDGADTVAASSDADNTLSLGGGVAYADLAFRRSGNDLILDAGAGDQVTFQNWYASTSYRSVVNLEVIAEAIAGFAQDGADPLLDDRIERFSFLGLVDRFDQARAANPSLTSWALSNALLEFHTSGSDTAAIGGDLAYQYGLNRTLAGIGVAPAQAVINDAQFGANAQTLSSVSSLSGAVRLA